MKGISYYLQIQYEDAEYYMLHEDVKPLPRAMTDTEARRLAKKYLASHPAPAGAEISLMFTRHSDGFTGEIDR